MASVEILDNRSALCGSSVAVEVGTPPTPSQNKPITKNRSRNWLIFNHDKFRVSYTACNPKEGSLLPRARRDPTCILAAPFSQIISEPLAGGKCSSISCPTPHTSPSQLTRKNLDVSLVRPTLKWLELQKFSRNQLFSYCSCLCPAVYSSISIPSGQRPPNICDQILECFHYQPYILSTLPPQHQVNYNHSELLKRLTGQWPNLLLPCPNR
jgi:hypothetical protein